MSPENDTPERDEKVVRLLRAAARDERAPESLREQVAAMRDDAGAARSSRTRRRMRLPRPAFNFAQFALPTTAAAVAALVLVLGGGAGAPSLAQAASLATRAPSAPAPRPDPGSPRKLSAKMGSLHFPNWKGGGWRAVGERHDKLGNRTATTVYYATGSNRVAYSILSTPVLTDLKARDGLILQSRPPQVVFTWHGRTTIVWEEAGHTCLLTGSGMSASRLWQLAFYGFRKPLG